MTIVSLLGRRSNKHRRIMDALGSESEDCPLRGTGTGCFAFVKAYLSCRWPSYCDPSTPHAGAGGARNRAISIKISWNICRDTATSANWKVT